MPKSTRTGATGSDGPVSRRVRLGGTDVELIGATSDLRLGGNVTVDGDLVVAGTTTMPYGATAEVDADSFESDQSGLSLTALTFVACPLQIVVGDYDTPVYVFGQGYGSHGSSNFALNAMLAPTGSTVITDAVLTTPNIFGATGTNWGWTLQGRLPAHSPGTYDVGFSASTTGTFTPRATAYVPSQVFAFRPLTIDEV